MRRLGTGSLAMALTLALAITSSLTACGGKSSTDAVLATTTDTTGTTTTVAVGTPTGTVTRADGCQIAFNASSCTALLSFTTTNATLPMLKVGVPLVSASHAAADFPVTIGHGSFAVVLSDGSTVLDGSASVSGACVAGSTWDGNACKPNV